MNLDFENRIRILNLIARVNYKKMYGKNPGLTWYQVKMKVNLMSSTD